MQLLITGITGFVGSHMAEHALAQGAEVFGSFRWRSKTDNIDHLRSKVTLVESDLRDLSSVRALLEAANPTHVIHLAAQSFVHASWKTPAETLTTNILAQVNLLEGLRGLKMSPRMEPCVQGFKDMFTVGSYGPELPKYKPSDFYDESLMQELDKSGFIDAAYKTARSSGGSK